MYYNADLYLLMDNVQKMKIIKSRYFLLALLFILYFSIRLYFSLSTPYFDDDYSYYALRQIENIAQTGKPLVDDGLSYGGRTFVFMPLYFYLLALPALIFPKIIAIKIINNLLASTLIIAVYLVCSKMIRNRKISLLCSIIAATLPIYITETLNNISAYSIIFPGGFFLLFLFLNLENHKLETYLITLVIILVLSSNSSFLLIFGLLIFLLLSYIENKNIDKIELEFISFFLMFYLWATFIIFKDAYQAHGLAIIWKNAPFEIIKTYFKNISIIDFLSNIGFLPLIFGSYSSYLYLFKKKSKNMLLFTSIFISSLVLLWVKLIPVELGLMFLGSSLVILFGQFVKDIFVNIRKSKFAAKENLIFFILVIVILITQVLPGMIAMNSYKGYDTNYISGFLWLRDNSPEDSIILSLPDEGHLISYFSKRKNVMDSEYLLIENVELRFDDILSFYKSKFKTPAIRILEKYNADYFIISETLKNYNIENSIFENDECFKLVYKKKIEIFHKQPC